MAAPLATCTNEEQRSVIRFLSSEGVKPIEIHRRMEGMVIHVCNYSKCIGGLGSSRTALVL
jgi:hypothetical protein